MRFRAFPVLVVALAAAGCFPQKAPHKLNVFTSLDKALAAPKEVECLDLHGKSLDALPADMAACTSLSELSLRQTGLSALPPCVRTFPALVLLDLGENNFTTFPDPEALAGLTTLYLPDNSLTALPGSITRLSKLTYLNLDRNRIVELPPEIGNLQTLKWLRLNGNKIAAIPDSMVNLKNLKRLYLKGNPLPESEKDKLKKMLPGTELIF